MRRRWGGMPSAATGVQPWAEAAAYTQADTDLRVTEAVVDQAEVEATWAAEIRRRVDDYRAGSVELLDLDESHAQLRAELAASRK